MTYRRRPSGCVSVFLVLFIPAFIVAAFQSGQYALGVAVVAMLVGAVLLASHRQRGRSEGAQDASASLACGGTTAGAGALWDVRSAEQRHGFLSLLRDCPDDEQRNPRDQSGLSADPLVSAGGAEGRNHHQPHHRRGEPRCSGLRSRPGRRVPALRLAHDPRRWQAGAPGGRPHRPRALRRAPIRQRRRAPPLPRLDLTTQDGLRWQCPLASPTSTVRPRPRRARSRHRR